MSDTRTQRISLSLHLLFTFLFVISAGWLMLAVPLWEQVDTSSLPVIGLVLLSVGLYLISDTWWQRQVSKIPVPRLLLPIGWSVLLIILCLLLLPSDLIGRDIVLVTFISLQIGLFILSRLLQPRTREKLINFTILVGTFLILFLILELVLASRITSAIAMWQRQTLIEDVTAPLDESDMSNYEAQTSAVSAPVLEMIEYGGGPAWGPLTGWGTNINTTLRWSLDGYFDTLIEYNSLGFRGPDVPYEKSNDMYRILIIGDSFVEAREVDYEDTFAVQLANLLADHTTPDRKSFEVIAVGTTGWGTLQGYLYYHHEGKKFSPDLVIHSFYINDVVDNHPQQFYPDRNLDFLIDSDTVTVLSEGSATNAPQVDLAQRAFDSLPSILTDLNITEMLRQVLAPPRQQVTITGDLGKVHPQTYIYLREPEIEGYAEAWERTQRAYEIWANEVHSVGSDFMVLAIDITAERVTELSTYFQEEQAGWVWDIDLPHKRLSDILAPLDVPLILTRGVYNELAETSNRNVYSYLFIPGDGHWNAEGHRITAELLFDALQSQGIAE